MRDDGIMHPVEDIFRYGEVVRGIVGWIDRPEFVHGDDMHCLQMADIHSKHTQHFPAVIRESVETVEAAVTEVESFIAQIGFPPCWPIYSADKTTDMGGELQQLADIYGKDLAFFVMCRR